MHDQNEAIETFKHAVHNGDAPALRQALKEFPQLRDHLDDPLFSFDSPAIRHAVDGKNRDLIDVLLDAGADINKRSEWKPGGWGVLDMVDDELGEYLISRGAKVTIHAAANLGKIDVIESLLREDPTLVNARGGDGATPLHLAKNVEVIDVLLAHGADVRIRDLDHGSTAAMWQIQNKETLYRLISAGAPIDIFMACRHGDIALAQRALAEDPSCLSAVIGKGKFAQKTGGDIYIWTLIGGGRPLGVASHFKHAKLVEVLLAAASPMEEFIFRCIDGEMEAAKEVLAKNPGLFTKLSPDELSLLPNAFWFGNTKCVQTLLALGFPKSGRGQDDGTLLHMAAWKGDAEMARELLKSDFDLEDAGDIYGSTPLGWACHGAKFGGQKDGDHPAVVKILLDAGADAAKPANKFGEPLLAWATPEIAVLLKAQGSSDLRTAPHEDK